MKTKLSREAAKAAAIAAGVNFAADFHALNFEKCRLLHDLAKASGYRKGAQALGSLGRCFFYHLAKLKP